MARRDKPRKPETSASTDWSQVADWYDQLVGDEGSEYHRNVVIPGVLRLLKPQPGQRIIDIACGQGVLCRILHEQKAHVTGVDAARPLIEAAKQRTDPAIEYFIGDARDLSFLPVEQFDAATCVLAIQNIHPIAPVFEHVGRLLKPRGALVLALMHPCFRGPKESSWGWDEQKKVQYRRVDRYLIPRKHPIVSHPGKKTGQYTWTFHKPLSDYFKTLSRAGFVVEALEEWPSHKKSEPGPRAGAENTAREEIPMFLGLRALKLATRDRE